MITPSQYESSHTRGMLFYGSTTITTGLASLGTTLFGASPAVRYPLYASTAMSAIMTLDHTLKLMKFYKIVKDRNYKIHYEARGDEDADWYAINPHLRPSEEDKGPWGYRPKKRPGDKDDDDFDDPQGGSSNSQPNASPKGDNNGGSDKLDFSSSEEYGAQVVLRNKDMNMQNTVRKILMSDIASAAFNAVAPAYDRIQRPLNAVIVTAGPVATAGGLAHMAFNSASQGAVAAGATLAVTGLAMTVTRTVPAVRKFARQFTRPNGKKFPALTPAE